MASHYEAPIRKPLVLGDKGYHDVTVDIAAPVEGRANKHWWIVFSIALAAFLWGVGCNHLYDFYRDRFLGIEQDRQLGMGYYQLCLVGRYWSRWDLDICCTFVV